MKSREIQTLRVKSINIRKVLNFALAILMVAMISCDDNDKDDNGDGNKDGTEKWIDNAGKTKQPGNSRDVRNNTNGFGTDNYTAISFEGETTLYAQNYGFGKTDGDNYNIKLYILKDGTYTHIGDIYGKGDNLKIDVFSGHKIRVVWQRHQIENNYYVVELTGKYSTTYKKDFKGENTGYTSGNVYVKYLK